MTIQAKPMNPPRMASTSSIAPVTVRPVPMVLLGAVVMSDTWPPKFVLSISKRSGQKGQEPTRRRYDVRAFTYFRNSDNVGRSTQSRMLLEITPLPPTRKTSSGS